MSFKTFVFSTKATLFSILSLSWTALHIARRWERNDWKKHGWLLSYVTIKHLSFLLICVGIAITSSDNSIGSTKVLEKLTPSFVPLQARLSHPSHDEHFLRKSSFMCEAYPNHHSINLGSCIECAGNILLIWYLSFIAFRKTTKCLLSKIYRTYVFPTNFLSSANFLAWEVYTFFFACPFSDASSI